jgi:hypothetical protein
LSIKTEKHHSKDYEGKIYVADFSFTTCRPFVQNANLFEVKKRLLIIQSDASFPYCVSGRQCTGFKEYAIKYGVNDKMEFGNR